MINKLSIAALTAVLLGGLSLFGCSDNSLNTEPSFGTFSNNNENTIATNVAQSELTLLKLAGVAADDGKGIFSIGWRQLFDPRNQTEVTMGQAMAIGFDNSQQTTPRRRGIDMGSVYVNYGSNHLALQKHTAPDGRIVYTSSLGPREGTTNIQFVANGTYQFEATGSSYFSAMNTSLTAPAALLNITSPVKGDSTNGTNDLTLTWQGGNTNAGVLIAVAALPPRPSGEPPQGPGGLPPGPGPLSGERRMPDGGGIGHPPPGGEHPMLDSTKAIVVKLNSNTGTYTIPASKIQDLISRTNAGGLMCTVSQMSVNDVDHDGGTVHVVFRNGDGVMVRVK